MSQMEREARIQAVAERLLVASVASGVSGRWVDRIGATFEAASEFVEECERRMAEAEAK